MLSYAHFTVYLTQPKACQLSKTPVCEGWCTILLIPLDCSAEVMVLSDLSGSHDFRPVPGISVAEMVSVARKMTQDVVQLC